MNRLATTLALVLALGATAATAGPGTQLLRSVESGLREYRIDADVDRLTTAQAAAIHLLVSSPQEDIIFGGAQVRQRIAAILRWEDATNPDLQ